MYILLLDGLFPKFVTCTSEAAFAGGAPDMTAISSPAAVSVATQAASSALSRLFMLCPVLSLGTSHPFGSSRSNTARSRKFFGSSRLCFPLLHPRLPRWPEERGRNLPRFTRFPLMCNRAGWRQQGKYARARNCLGDEGEAGPD